MANGIAELGVTRDRHAPAHAGRTPAFLKNESGRDADARASCPVRVLKALKRALFPLDEPVRPTGENLEEEIDKSNVVIQYLKVRSGLRFSIRALRYESIEAPESNGFFLAENARRPEAATVRTTTGSLAVACRQFRGYAHADGHRLPCAHLYRLHSGYRLVWSDGGPHILRYKKPSR